MINTLRHSGILSTLPYFFLPYPIQRLRLYRSGFLYGIGLEHIEYPEFIKIVYLSRDVYSSRRRIDEQLGA